MTQATHKLDEELFNSPFARFNIDTINKMLPFNLVGCVKNITQRRSERLFGSMISVDLEQPDGSVESIEFQVPKMTLFMDVFSYIVKQIIEHFDE